MISCKIGHAYTVQGYIKFKTYPANVKPSGAFLRRLQTIISVTACFVAFRLTKR